MTALKPRRIDLYQSFFEKIPITRKQERHIAIILLPILLVAAMGGCYGFLQLSIYDLNRQIAPVATYLNTADTQTLHQYADALQIENDSLTVAADNMKALTSATDSYPHLPQDMLESVYSLAGDTVSVVTVTYSSETGILGISVVADRPESGQSYMQRLRQTGCFTTLTHTGYTDESAGGTIYAIDIFAMLPSPKEVQP